MDPIIPVQNQDFSGDGKELTKVLGADVETKSHLHSQLIHQNLAKHVKIFLGIIVRQQRADRKLMGLLARAVRRIKEGTSAVLLQSGLDEKWRGDSMECYCYLRSIQDLLSDGKTLYEQRFGETFNGPIVPFGAMIDYHPISAEDLSRLHLVGPKVMPGIFLGYALHAG